MGEFKVALVGRPNVGKSSLFNVLTRSREALVKDVPGLTRDFRVGKASWWDQDFEVVDTGGWTDADDMVSSSIRSRLEEELKKFNLALFICDIKEGLNSDDRNFLSVLRASGIPFLVVLNKCDNQSYDSYDFFQLGVDEFYPISCEHKIGIDDLVEKVISVVPDEVKNVEEEEPFDLRLTVVGKPNVGKSSLVNRVLNRNQQLVSDVAGTTTDSLEFVAEREHLKFSIYDTAGIRRKAKRDGGVEGLTFIKSLETIADSDFVLIVLDGTENPSRADARLIEKCVELHKPFLVVANKWDLSADKEDLNRDTFKALLKKEFHFLKDIEIVFVSALTGSGIGKLFAKILEIKEKLSKRISTGQLNQFLRKIYHLAPTPFYNNRAVKFYYITQTRQVPPSFICFTNYPDGIPRNYRKFMENQIRKEWGFEGVPVRIFFLPKNSKSSESNKRESL